MATSLGVASQYNALIFGDLNSFTGDTEGRLAVGGDFRTPNSYSVGIAVIGSQLPNDPRRDDLIVGQDFVNGPNAWAVRGNFVYGGTASGTPITHLAGSTRSQSPILLDPATGNAVTVGGETFADAQRELIDKSAFWGGLLDRGVVEEKLQFGTLTLTGDDPTLNVFNITADQWGPGVHTRIITAKPGSTVLINIAGTVQDMSGGYELKGGLDRSHVLLNYYQTTQFKTSAMAIQGSVLAPLADATLRGGSINGRAVFGGDATQDVGFEFHNFDFKGDLPEVAPPTPEADLQITKVASNLRPNVGETFTYTVTVRNNGPDGASGVVVTDTIPIGLDIESFDTNVGEFDPDTSTWLVGDLANGATATLLITARAATCDPLTNTASVLSASPDDPDLENNQASVTVTPLWADLALSKSVGTRVVPVGGQVVFGIRLVNNGPDPSRSVVVSDQLPDGLTLLSASPSVGTYDPATGLWSVGDLDAGARATLTLVVSPTIAGFFTNTAAIASTGTYDCIPDNNAASAEMETSPSISEPVADLALTKTVDVERPNVGDTVTYTLRVTNAGPATAEDVVIADTVPAGILVTGQTPSQGSIEFNTGTWLVGAIPPGGSATLVVTAKVLNCDTWTNTARIIASSAADPTPSDNEASASVTPLTADLSLSKAFEDVATVLGGTATFTLTLANHGPDAATGVVVADELPEGVVFTSATPSRGTYDPATGRWTVGNLAAGAVATLTVRVRVMAPGPLVNLATIVASGTFDCVPGNNTASALVAGLPAQVTAVQRFGFHAQPTAIVVSYNQALDPATAGNVQNYRIERLGPGGHRVLRVVRLKSASYDPTANTVTLAIAGPRPFLYWVGGTYRLTINAKPPSGVTNANGSPLDGSGKGQPGTDYVRVFRREILAGRNPRFTQPFHRQRRASPALVAASRGLAPGDRPARSRVAPRF